MQAKATKAMVDATFKNTQIIEDANLFMLMTHLTNGVISDTVTRYLKLHQEEELDKLEAHLAKVHAQKENVQPNCRLISVESVGGAIGIPTWDHAESHSPWLFEEEDVEDGLTERLDDFGSPV